MIAFAWLPLLSALAWFRAAAMADGWRYLVIGSVALVTQATALALVLLLAVPNWEAGGLGWTPQALKDWRVGVPVGAFALATLISSLIYTRRRNWVRVAERLARSSPRFRRWTFVCGMLALVPICTLPPIREFGLVLRIFSVFAFVLGVGWIMQSVPIHISGSRGINPQAAGPRLRDRLLFHASSITRTLGRVLVPIMVLASVLIGLSAAAEYVIESPSVHRYVTQSLRMSPLIIPVAVRVLCLCVAVTLACGMVYGLIGLQYTDYIFGIDESLDQVMVVNDMPRFAKLMTSVVNWLEIHDVVYRYERARTNRQPTQQQIPPLPVSDWEFVATKARQYAAKSLGATNDQQEMKAWRDQRIGPTLKEPAWSWQIYSTLYPLAASYRQGQGGWLILAWLVTLAMCAACLFAPDAVRPWTDLTGVRGFVMGS